MHRNLVAILFSLQVRMWYDLMRQETAAELIQGLPKLVAVSDVAFVATLNMRNQSIMSFE
jgi:hypothetical protein